MLSRYFGFLQDPFGATLDPRYLYQSHTHREALASLYYAYYGNRGFSALVAPPGLGKTTLLFHFLNHIRDSARTVFLFNTQCEPRDLLRYILRDLGIAPTQDIVEMHHQLNEILLTEAGAGRRFVLIIDEAQNLSDAALETVRLLTNFETPRAKLMQIVLAGQPQLSEKLMSSSLLQLRQRISTICRLESFSTEETRAYVGHRLSVAGYSGAPLFTEGALSLITEASQGIPRTINNLCFNALSLCCALKRKQVDRKMADEVVADQQLIPESKDTLAVVHGIPPKRGCGPKQPKQFSRLAKHWAPAVAVLLVASVLGVLGLTRFHRTGKVYSSDAKVLLASPPEPVTTKVRELSVSPKTTQLEVTVEPHQTLGIIAMEHLGYYDGDCLHQIQMLNPGLIDPNLIRPGQMIQLPAPMSPTVRNVTFQARVRNLP